MMSPKVPTRIDKRIGDNIRGARLAAGISQTALGERIGVTFQQVQKYESGANRIAASKLYAIAQALAAPVDSFFAGLIGRGR